MPESRFLPTILLVLSAVFFIWQNLLAQLPESERFIQGTDGLYDYIPSQGDELRYVVTYPDGSQYDFVITLLQYDHSGNAEFPIAFRWNIGEPLNSTGIIELCAPCLEESVMYLNYFKDNTYLKYTELLTVFISSKNFSQILSPPYRTVMIMDGEELTFYAYPKHEGFPVLVGQKNIQLRTQRMSNSAQGEGNKEVRFIPGNHRLITAMKLNFTIELKEIKLAY